MNEQQMLYFTWPMAVCLWCILFGCVLARFEYYRRAYIVLGAGYAITLVAAP